MRRNDTLTLMAAFALTATLGACDGSSGNGSQATALGAQIDRMGRSAVNTALIGTFNPDATTRGALKDDYNQAADSSAWVALFAGEMSGNLAIYDSLDQVCGNQLLAAEGPAAPGRYDGFAAVLADDMLYVNTAADECGVYLAVEANATGLIPNDNCGGRTPNDDTMDVTYSALAIGGVSGVTDGVPADGDGSVHSDSVFPFLAPPLLL